MRRLAALLLTAVLLLAALAGCASMPRNAADIKQTPARFGKREIHADGFRYRLEEALAKSDVVADVTVVSWLDERLEDFPPMTFFSVKANTLYKGNIPDIFVMMQNGNQEITLEDYPLFQVGDRLLVFLFGPIAQEEWDGSRRITGVDGAYSILAAHASVLGIHAMEDTLYAIDRDGYITGAVGNPLRDGGERTVIDGQTQNALYDQARVYEQHESPLGLRGPIRPRAFLYDEIVREIQYLLREGGEQP
ncbi:MAG: hypothetical protein FWG93_01200 [Oscillospiraceae bacterium]|nr:hypothetical protein [Oscillospiraceae bacterium]